MGYSPPWQHQQTTAPSRAPASSASSQYQHQPSSNMSILAMATPHPHSAFGRDLPWDHNRSMDYGARSRPEPEKVSLPSIRQAFPEIHIPVQQQDGHSKTPSSTITSPPTGAPSGVMTPPEYIHSPNSNKRRRLSVEDEQEMERASRVPRLYEPTAMPQRQISPPPSRPAVEGWATHPRTSPYPPQHAMPPMPPAPPMERSERLEHRPALPSLPPVATFDHRDAAMHAQRQRGHSSEDFQQVRPAPTGPMAESGPSYRTGGGGGYPYGYHHPSRHQSLSLGSIQPFDRTPFSAGGYAPQYPEYMRIGELGPMSMHGDSKQRKRRGNLPKETTDKLRAWFVAHLQHPYPTEDEKQDLMRQTGLQMNQISNWFINARRRQLPTMINNARAESDAMSGSRSGAGGKVLPTTERADHYGAPDVSEPGKSRSSVPLSDGEASYQDEELDALSHQRRAPRGSV